MVYVIAEPCIDMLDRSCTDVCPVDCIYEGKRKLYINPEECIDCGACLTACPNNAIFRSDLLPPQWSVYEQVDAWYTSEVSAVGGAIVVGPIGADHPRVAAMPGR
jgi:NAD-dependent dihydropyrimidine dehydrogenase PreA subunit